MRSGSDEVAGAVPLPPLGERDTVVATEQARLGRVVLHQHDHVLHQVGQRRRDAVEAVGDEILEPVPSDIDHPPTVLA